MRCPGNKCLLKNCSSFLPLSQFKVGQRSVRGRLGTFYALLPHSGAAPVPSNRGKTMAPGSLLSHTSMAFTYNLVQWINTHAKEREGIHCISSFLSANPICSQAKNILLHSINYPNVKYHINKKAGKKQQM